jgi:hypothetical protein
MALRSRLLPSTSPISRPCAPLPLQCTHAAFVPQLLQCTHAAFVLSCSPTHVAFPSGANHWRTLCRSAGALPAARAQAGSTFTRWRWSVHRVPVVQAAARACTSPRCGSWMLQTAAWQGVRPMVITCCSIISRRRRRRRPWCSRTTRGRFQSR